MVQRFSETRSAFEAGAVAHALAAAMRDLLADWHLFVTQLEHQMRIGKLTLQVSWMIYAASTPIVASIPTGSTRCGSASSTAGVTSGALSNIWP